MNPKNTLYEWFNEHYIPYNSSKYTPIEKPFSEADVKLCADLLLDSFKNRHGDAFVDEDTSNTIHNNSIDYNESVDVIDIYKNNNNTISIKYSNYNIVVISESDYFKGLERIPYGDLIKSYALEVITTY